LAFKGIMKNFWLASFPPLGEIKIGEGLVGFALGEILIKKSF